MIFTLILMRPKSPIWWYYETIRKKRRKIIHSIPTLFFLQQILCELDALCIATTERAKSTMALADYVTDYKLSKDNFVFPQILRNLRYNSDRSTRNFRIIKDYVRALQVFIRPMLVASSPSLSYPFADVL